MSNYTRTLARMWRKSGSDFSSEQLNFVCNAIRTELRAWGAIQVFSSANNPYADIRFTCKWQPFVLLQNFGFDVWTITSYEGGFDRDVLDFFSGTQHKQLGLARFSVDEIRIKTAHRGTSPEQIGIGDMKYKVTQDGFSVDCDGSYRASTFLYYGDNDPECKFFDEKHSQTDLDSCSDGCIDDPVFTPPFQFANRFLNEVPSIWHGDGWHPGPGSKRRFPSVEAVELCFRGHRNHLLTFSREASRWTYKSFDGFQNLANTEYADYEREHLARS